MSPREPQLPAITPFFVYFYFLVCTITIAATTGCVVEQKKFYDLLCSYYSCFAFYILEPLVHHSCLLFHPPTMLILRF
jgi:hypothetical protein